MKVHKKITLLLTALLLASIVWIPRIGHATTEYSYGNQSCGVDRGTDVVFVINDSQAMLAVDLDPDPTTNKNYISESIAYTNSFQKKDRVGVIGFNTTAISHQTLTDNRFLSDAAFKTFLTADSNTAGGNNLSTGIEKALDEFSKSTSANEKVMIIMTTGDSIDNQKSLDLARKAYENNITIHVFGFGSSMGIDQTNLTRIAQSTGGSYYHSPRATDLAKNLASLNSAVIGFSGRELHSDWTLTNDVVETNGLLLHDNVKVNLNGYKLEVKGDLVLQSCAELRAVSGVVTANNVEQKSGSMISLNNSQLNVKNTLMQSGLLRVNGDYGGASTPEVIVNNYNQKIRGVVDLTGRSLLVKGNFDQEGRVQVGGGMLEVTGDVTQKGFFNLQKGKLFVKGNLMINGETLRDDAFMENRSMNVDGGIVQVGSAESMAETREKGNIRQASGQLFVNNGTVRVFGDYSIADGWLTMTKGSMDTTTADYGEGDGDFVHVYRDFSTSSKRNHAKHDFVYLGKPMHDQSHLTDGVLRVDGNFNQLGDKQFDPKYSDRSQNYTQDYSRLNFNSAGRHKVLLTGKGNINVEGTGFTFNILEVKGYLSDYKQSGPVKHKQLIERSVSANTKLASLSINDVGVFGFNPNVTTYFNHTVPAGSLTGGVQTLKVVARAEDHRNATVQVLNSVVGTDGTAKVQVLVTAHDGVTQAVYTVHVTVGAGSDGRVTSIVLQQKELSFMKNNDGNYSPGKATIGYTVYPTNAANQQVIWSSTNPAVATVREGIVTPVGVGETSIVAKTVDGNFVDSAVVKVLSPHDLLEGVKTFADLVSDNNRYDQILALYDLNDIGIVVPGRYIQKVEFPNNASGYLTSGTITIDSTVERVVVRVNGQQLSVPKPSSGTTIFSRAGLSMNDYIEVIAYNVAGDELEKIATYYPVGFEPDSSIPYGYYSIQRLLGDPYLLELILDRYALDQLPFTAR